VNPKTGQALLLAIRKEAEAQAFYKAAVAKARNPLVRRRLLGLAEDEAQHEATLARLYWSQTGKEPGETLPGAPQAGPDLAGLDLAALLRMAIAEEDRAAAEYARMAEEAADPRARSFLEYLVDLENGHSRALSDELAHIEKDPAWPGRTETGDR